MAAATAIVTRPIMARKPSKPRMRGTNPICALAAVGRKASGCDCSEAVDDDGPDEEPIHLAVHRPEKRSFGSLDQVALCVEK